MSRRSTRNVTGRPPHKSSDRFARPMIGAIRRVLTDSTEQRVMSQDMNFVIPLHSPSFAACAEIVTPNVTMGQEQSYGAPASGQHPRPRHKDRYEDPLQYRDRHPTVGCRDQNDYQDPSDYKRHRVRRSTDSTKSDNSSTESSGYRSGSNSGYEYRSASERSTTSSDYYHLSLYKNDHYKDVNKELYRPVKIPKDKRCKLQLLDVEEAKDMKKESRRKGT
ncbi:hypothetical protein EVAR_27129_1 [Eumeta japonica]|uniref:Uncharacterized protein n=1 Tax=Eumeta variegata TaxID=151549 RepID=A0A4C1VYR5_EUMVA|nr:hypothetical protein EVAR_27129_1 [Eumeta japonica]